MRDVMRSFSPQSDPHASKIEQMMPHLQVLALRAREQGHHYDGYKVGASALIVTPAGYDLVHGSNFKTHPGTDGPRVCAEEELLARAALKGATSVLAIAIAAEFKLDDYSGKTMDGSLPPCAKCRYEQFAQRIQQGDMVTARTRFMSMRIETVGTDIHVLSKPCWTVGKILREFGAEPP
jgi:cytidine deaminase